MKERTREKLALIIFAFLVAFAGIVLFSYFATGRTWTVAATVVDDRLGELDGYTAVVYGGVIDPDVRTDKKSKSSNGVISGTDESVLGGKSIGLIMMSVYSQFGEEGYKGVFVSDVRDIYESKNARVVTIDLSDPSKYRMPQTFKVGEKKVGVFYLDGYANRHQIAQTTLELKERGADSIICIATRPAVISTYEGIDVVILTSSQNEYSVANKPDDDTLLITSPDIGDVGVILFSSNNVPSSHFINALN